MLTAIKSKSNEQVIACDVTKEEGPFICYECHETLTLKKGKYVTHHFAHKPNTVCSAGKGETKEHRECKMGIYNALKQQNIPVHMDYDLGGIRPDLLVLLPGTGIYMAIQIQRSGISEEEVKKKTALLTSRGCPVVWIVTRKLPTDPDNMDYRAHIWEKWVYVRQGCMAFFWDKEDSLKPVMFYPRSKWVEPYSSYGGHYRKSKCTFHARVFPSVKIISLKIYHPHPKQISAITLTHPNIHMYPRSIPFIHTARGGHPSDYKTSIPVQLDDLGLK